MKQIKDLLNDCKKKNGNKENQMNKEEFKALRISKTGRKRRGKQHNSMSQSEFAEWSGMTLDKVRNIEQGKAEVPGWFIKHCT